MNKAVLRHGYAMCYQSLTLQVPNAVKSPLAYSTFCSYCPKIRINLLAFGGDYPYFSLPTEKSRPMSSVFVGRNHIPWPVTGDVISQQGAIYVGRQGKRRQGNGCGLLDLREVSALGKFEAILISFLILSR